MSFVMKKSVLISLLGCLTLLLSCQQNLDPFSSKGNGDGTLGFRCGDDGYVQLNLGAMFGAYPQTRLYKDGDEMVLMSIVNCQTNYKASNRIRFVEFRIPSDQVKEGRTIQLSGSQVLVSYISDNLYAKTHSEYVDEFRYFAFLYPVSASITFQIINESIFFGNFTVNGALTEQDGGAKVTLADGIFDVVLCTGTESDDLSHNHDSLYPRYLEYITGF